jgi:hypothetical protein
MDKAQEGGKNENQNQNRHSSRSTFLLTGTVTLFVRHGSTSAMFGFANRSPLIQPVPTVEDPDSVPSQHFAKI